MQHRVLRSLFIATTALLLTTSACDKGGDKKADAKKVDDKKTDEKKTDDKADAGEAAAAEAGAAEAGEAVAAEAGAAEAGEAAAAEAGAAEAGEAAAAEAGAAEAGAAEAGEVEAAEGGEAEAAPDPKADPKADPKKGGGEKAAAGPKIDGKPLFEAKCKSCHGIDGKGDTTIGKKLEIPALSKTKLSKSKIISVLNKGVPDTKMKSYKTKFSPEEIDGIAAYVKKL